MDKAKSGLIKSCLLKREVLRFSAIFFARPPSCESYFKVIVRLLVFLLAIWKPVGMENGDNFSSCSETSVLACFGRDKI
jgi:uncharacterized membrane protein